MHIYDYLLGIKDELIELSRFIYENPELGHREYKSSKAHVELLKRHGFKVEYPYLGLDTAFKAEFGEGDTTICYMAEYDALPEIGHGCGHNILGTLSTASALALKKEIEEGANGKVILFGTPAEETDGAKVNISKENELKDVDACIIMHPGTEFRLSGTSLAMVTRRFEFFGKTAHAAGNPELGINALDAQIILFSSLNAMRQQMLSSAKIHGIIANGGVAANIIPDYTDSRFYIRAATKQYMMELTEKLENCAKAAALATGCEVKITEYELGYDDLVSNEALNELLKQKLKLYTDEEIHPAEDMKGSVDAGNVSHHVPTIHGYFPITKEDISAHTVEFREASLTDYANENMLKTASAIADMGLEIINDENLKKKISDEYKKALEDGRVIP